MIDIALLTYMHDFESYRMTISCIANVKKFTRIPYRLIWVDNGSPFDFFKSIKFIIQKNFHTTLINRMGKNEFYAKGTNQGMKISNAKYVVNLSNDVFVSEGWAGKLLFHMEKDPKIGLISPLTDNIGCHSAKAEHHFQGCDPIAINKSSPRFYQANGNVSMFCSMVRKKMVDQIGFLCEKFFILGNDDDYNDRIRLSGWKTGVALDCFVWHLHGVTKNKLYPLGSAERIALKEKHRGLLKQRMSERRKKNA